jgi:hypothetical protein
MSEAEFIILDQLYFVSSYKDVSDACGLDERSFADTLWGLINKGWVKCLSDPENEVEIEEDEFKSNYSNYHYLASKKGLLVHNGC